MWSGLSDFLIMTAQMASFILLGRNLGTAGYGGYIGLYGVIGPIGALSWSGLVLLVMQQILREGRDPVQVGRQTLSLAMGQGLVAAAIAFAVATQVISSLSATVIILLIIVDLLTTPLIMVTAGLRQAIVGFPEAAKVRIVLVILRATVLVSLWAAGQLTLRNLALGWIIVLQIFLAYCLKVLWPKMGLEVGFSRPTRKGQKTNMQLSFPLASSNLQKDGDKAVLNAFGFLSDAGIYGAAFRIVFMAQLPIQALNNALFHRFLSNDEADKGQHVRRSYRFSIVSLGLSLGIGAVIWLIAPLLTIALGEEFAPSVSIIRWLLVFLPLTALSRAPLNGLLGLDATGVRAFIVLSSAALAMALYIALIPSRSWEGAVIGTIVSECYLGLAGWYALVRTERIADAAVSQEAAGTALDSTALDSTPLTR